MCRLRFALHAATAPASPRRIPCFGLALARPAAPSAGAVEYMSANMIKPVLAEVGGRGLLRPTASFIMRSLSAICQTGHTALPNGPFCSAKTPVLQCRMARLAFPPVRRTVVGGHFLRIDCRCVALLPVQVPRSPRCSPPEGGEQFVERLVGIGAVVEQAYKLAAYDGPGRISLCAFESLSV